VTWAANTTSKDRMHRARLLREQGLTWAQVGSALGVSRQRAYQIANPTAPTPPSIRYLRVAPRQVARAALVDETQGAAR